MADDRLFCSQHKSPQGSYAVFPITKCQCTRVGLPWTSSENSTVRTVAHFLFLYSTVIIFMPSPTIIGGGIMF